MRHTAGWLRGAAALALLALVSCSPRNPALESPFDPARGYRFSALDREPESDPGDGTFVVLTLSGGGTRAAAFAYGVMDGLRRTRLADGSVLLDEVDVIS